MDYSEVVNSFYLNEAVLFFFLLNKESDGNLILNTEIISFNLLLWMSCYSDLLKDKIVILII